MRAAVRPRPPVHRSSPCTTRRPKHPSRPNRPRPDRLAGLLALASAALACVSPSGARYRSLSEDLRSSPSAAEHTLDSGARLFAGEPILDRRRLVAAVLERNPSLAVARQAYRAALARYPQASGLDDPMLGMGVAPLSFGSRRVDRAGRVDLSQRLPFPGKRRLRGEAALAEAEAVGRDLESMRLELATLASKLFDDWTLAARALEINREHATLLGELHRVALARYAAGEDSKPSVLKAELACSRAMVEQSELESEARVVAEQINALLHRAAGLSIPAAPPSSGHAARLAELGSDDEAVDGNAPVHADGDFIGAARGGGIDAKLLDEALAARPELAAAAAREQAAHARVDLAVREFLPDFTVMGAYDRLWQESPLVPYVGVQLNVPLQLGRRRAALEESRAELEGSRQRRLALEDDVRLAVESAGLRLAQARRAERLVRDRLLPAASEQVSATRSAYASGGSRFFDLIDALRELHELELEHETTLARIAQRRAELDRALGRMPGLSW
ncbi:MAG: TolC family protein [Deltaproteobacteria bacterium]|nr:TolC family protein [Deltaproteobacteria bacterium]